MGFANTDATMGVVLFLTRRDPRLEIIARAQKEWPWLNQAVCPPHLLVWHQTRSKIISELGLHGTDFLKAFRTSTVPPYHMQQVQAFTPAHYTEHGSIKWIDSAPSDRRSGG